jgi:hypothetical protein
MAQALKRYSVKQIAGSYQASHLTIWNMPSDEEFLYALRINGHEPSKLDEVKEEYCNRSRAVWTGE